MRALVPNNGSKFSETRYQGLTFKTNVVPGQTLKSLNDLNDAYWTFLGDNPFARVLFSSEIGCAYHARDRLGQFELASVHHNMLNTVTWVIPHSEIFDTFLVLFTIMHGTRSVVSCRWHVLHADNRSIVHHCIK